MTEASTGTSTESVTQIPSGATPGSPTQASTGIPSKANMGTPSQANTSAEIQIYTGTPTKLSTGTTTGTATGIGTKSAISATSLIGKNNGTSESTTDIGSGDTIPASGTPTSASAAGKVEIDVTRTWMSILMGMFGFRIAPLIMIV